MKQIPFHHLACPLDGLPLMRRGQSMFCPNNHNYDFDRKNTLNLLPVQFKKSKQPGDSKEMVSARQIFLDAGFYQPVADTLNELITQYRPSDELSIFDAGCGEGYYTAALTAHLQSSKQPNDFSVVGMDISKFAIAAAVKRHASILWITGTNAKIPILDQSIDIVTSLFGFPVWPEFHRILKPGGIVITAESGPDHLIELRRVLYPQINQKTETKSAPENFTQTKQQRLTIRITPPAPEFLSAQIMMTPHGFRSTPDKIAEAVQAMYEIMTLDVIFTVFSYT